MAEPKQPIINVAIDDGFRQTKIVTSTGFKLSIPSVARTGFTITSVNGDAGEGGYETEGKRYTVHADIDGEDTRFDDYATSPINRVLVHHVMQMADLAGKPVALCTGVPFQTYFRAASSEINNEMVAAKIANLNVPVAPLNGREQPQIVRQQVTAQGLTAYIDYMTDDKGGYREGRRRESPYAVVDIGGRTTDCVTVLAGGESLDHAASGTGNIGVSNIYDLIDAALVKRFGQRLRLATLDGVARNRFIRWRGEQHDVSAVVDAAVEEVAQQVVRELKRRIGDAGEMDAVLLTGGGAVLMHATLQRAYPHCIVMDEPGFANARGMLKILNFGGGHG